MTDVVKAMRARRDELRQKLGASPEFREYEMLETFIRQYESVIRADDLDLKPVDLGSPQLSTRSTKSTVAEAAAAAIENVGSPMTLQELIRVLPRYGKMPSGKRPDINLSSALSRDSRFKIVPWRGSRAWWLRGRELPSAAETAGGSAADAPAAAIDDGETMEDYHAAA